MAILTYLDAHGFSAWGQPNRGEYDPKTNKWRPHPNSAWRRAFYAARGRRSGVTRPS